MKKNKKVMDEIGMSERISAIEGGSDYMSLSYSSLGGPSDDKECPTASTAETIHTPKIE